MFLNFCLWKMIFLSAWSPTGHAKYSSLPEVVIPLSITVTSRNNISSGWLSYSLNIGGQRHIITMKPKKNLISRDFILFTYTQQGDLIEEQPFVQNDCYYFGYVDEDPESLVIVNTCFGSLQGILEINGTTYEIMPKSSTSTFEHLAYKMNSGASESFPMRCGLSEEEIARQMKHQESNVLTRVQLPYENWWTHHRLIEYFVVIDHKRYLHRNNITTCIHDMLQVVNGIDGYYLQLDTDVLLTTLEVWNEKNHVNVERNIDNVLDDFCNWKRRKFGERVRHDIIHLFVKRGYGAHLGIAKVATICTSASCAVNMFVSDAMLDIAFVTAHEMGHNLGMRHDARGCTCGRKNCIMAAYKSNSPKFSNCSYEEMYRFVNQRICLYDFPEKLVTLVTANQTECGNKLVEEGEQCDCGNLGSCLNDPCCSKGCVLKPDAQCAFGLCCKDCQFLPTGIMCRKAKNECDLPEWCNGTSDECPGDVYKEDGNPCSGDGYCYKMECHQHDEQCRKIFGNGSRSADEICYMEMNKRGDRFGNCGNDSSKYRRCKLADVFCGRIQCENVVELPQRKNHETVHYSHFNNVTCWTVDYHFGITIDDVGAVSDGTACAPDYLCVDRKCVSKSLLISNCSPQLCNMQGVCNNRHHCHCDVTWKPPDCQQRGYGGSIDSGPPPVPLSASNWSMYFLTFLVMYVLGLISLYGLHKLRKQSLIKAVPDSISGDKISP